MNLKKPKFWDYEKPSFVSYLLLPFAILIRILNSTKRKSQVENIGIKTICVGNIYVGGTGKTSLSIKINQILNKHKIKSCFIKKYYSNQKDEQQLLKNNGDLFLNIKRINAINEAIKEGYEVAILDDGLQDYSINYDTTFVCFNNINWIGNGLTIPAGPLRESISNLKNYQHVFLNGNLENLENLKKYIFGINSKINLHLGKYVPLNLDEFDNQEKYLVFSGIGNHATFISMLKNHKLNIVKDIEFPDHYKYTSNDIKKILTQSKEMNSKIITTEKDFYRLGNNKINGIKIIKSELQIIDEDKLINTILNNNETS
ncbi:tetraacyldisaccharide 4'-kinase [Candidatus Pelagibacter sp.]|nr:tetraacyldisaccharide 4'-kinase [Candidatus Pelagibacter sp.]